MFSRFARLISPLPSRVGLFLAAACMTLTAVAAAQGNPDDAWRLLIGGVVSLTSTCLFVAIADFFISGGQSLDS